MQKNKYDVLRKRIQKNQHTYALRNTNSRKVKSLSNMAGDRKKDEANSVDLNQTVCLTDDDDEEGLNERVQLKIDEDTVLINGRDGNYYVDVNMHTITQEVPIKSAEFLKDFVFDSTCLWGSVANLGITLNLSDIASFKAQKTLEGQLAWLNKKTDHMFFESWRKDVTPLGDAENKLFKLSERGEKGILLYRNELYLDKKYHSVVIVNNEPIPKKMTGAYTNKTIVEAILIEAAQKPKKSDQKDDDDEEEETNEFKYMGIKRKQL